MILGCKQSFLYEQGNRKKKKLHHFLSNQGISCSVVEQNDSNLAKHL